MEILFFILYLHLAIFVAAAGFLGLASASQWIASLAGLDALQTCARCLHKAAQAITLLLAACVIGTFLTFVVGFFWSIFS